MGVRSSTYCHALLEGSSVTRHHTHRLALLLPEIVMVVTVDGRIIVGNFVGNDHVQNVILRDTHERLYSEDEDMEKIPLGLYVIRGDSVCVIGEFVDGDSADAIRVPAPIPSIRQQQFF